MVKKKVYAYYDGSNFYHYLKSNYGITNIFFHHMTHQLMDLEREELVKIKYFNCPTNQQENPEIYASQLKFFQKLKQTPFLELLYGRLARRPLNEINIDCITCGHQKANSITCPICSKEIDISKCYKSMEKGVDVKLSTHMILDAITNKYDVALLFSADADFCPAINHIVKTLHKEVIFCHFPGNKTYELKKACSSSRIITKEMVEKSQTNYSES